MPVRACAPIITLSSTVMVWNSARFWKVRPMPKRGMAWAGWAAAAGLLVGFGTRLGGGCTSGHGVCGIGRLSMRSFAAVAIFMAAGMAATFVVRHVLA